MQKQGWRIILLLLVTFVVLGAAVTYRGQLSSRSPQSPKAPTLVQKKSDHFSEKQKRTFISEVGNPAVKLYLKDRQVLPSVVIAQAILESQFGTSELTTTANNLFGIKGSYRGGRCSFIPKKLKTARPSKFWPSFENIRAWLLQSPITISSSVPNLLSPKIF